MSNYIMELRKLVGSRPLITCGACVIFVDDAGRILLQRRTDNGMWGLPGGSMEPGEDLQDTARHEAREEVGLICHNLKLLNVYSGPQLYYRYPHGDEIYNVAAAYLCRDFSGTLAADQEETADAQFFALSDLPSEINPPDRPVLNEFVRSHGG
jgi:8-oxo-dGTP pyrophosphatase MutT (NUDIX family)